MATDPRMAAMQQMMAGGPAQQAPQQGADPLQAVAAVLAELGAMPPKQAITLATMKQQQATTPEEQQLWQQVISQLTTSMQQPAAGGAPNIVQRTLGQGMV